MSGTTSRNRTGILWSTLGRATLVAAWVAVVLTALAFVLALVRAAWTHACVVLVVGACLSAVLFLVAHASRRRTDASIVRPS